MGVYSTLHITRSKALELVSEQLEQALARVRTGQCSDDELVRHLDTVLEPHLNNASIVDDDAERNDDDRMPYLGCAADYTPA